MIKRFDKEYAIDLYNYHKILIEEINIFSKKFARTGELTQDNPDIAKYFTERANNMQMDYERKLSSLKALINENLSLNDRIKNF